MATGGGPRSLSDVVECDICMEIMTRPQALSCMHHLCKTCTEKLDRVNNEGVSVVSCPTCRVFTADSDIKDSFMMNTLIDIYNNKQSADATVHGEQKNCKKCKLCDKSEATLVCHECQLKLCNSCKIEHLLIPSYKHHYIIPIDENTAVTNSLINVIKYCPKHPMYPIKYNCIPCNMAVCAECKIVAHDVHETESVENALQKMLTQSKAHIGTINDQRSKLKENLHQVRNLKGECQSNCDATKKSIRQHAKKMTAKLQEDSQELIEQVDVQHQAAMKELDLEESDIEHQIASHESILSWSSTIVKMTEGPGVLCELQEGLYQRIETCANHPPLTGPTTVQMPEVTFSTHIFVPENAVGKLHTQQRPVNKQEVPIQSVRPAAMSRDIVSFRTTTADLTTLSKKTFKVKDCFKLKRKCVRICYYEGKFWCPCPLESMIDVYSNNGQLVNTIQSPDIKCPESVHPINDHQLIVAAASGLFVMNIDEKENRKVLDGNFRDVHMSRNIITALQKTGTKQSVIQLLKNTDPPAVQGNIRLDNENCLRVMITDEHIYASVCDFKKQSYIVQYSHTRNRLCQYGMLGMGEPGKLHGPLLCSLDQQQSVLVADHNNRGFHVLDSKGQWSMLEYLKLDMFPRDVVFTPPFYLHI